MGRGRLLAWLLMVGALVVGASPRVRAGEVQTAKQSVSGGGVTVAVTYLKDQADALAFHVVLDTHSVNP